METELVRVWVVLTGTYKHEIKENVSTHPAQEDFLFWTFISHNFLSDAKDVQIHTSGALRNPPRSVKAARYLRFEIVTRQRPRAHCVTFCQCHCFL